MTINLFRQTIRTPLGEMTTIATARGIVFCDFSDSPCFEREWTGMMRYMPRAVRLVDRSHPLLETLERQIQEYFAGLRQTFDVPLCPVGTPFQLDVWRVLLTIPYGETCSYADEARKLGNPKALRAVANANGRNRMPILIPCHRVVGADGSLTGYSCGIDRKAELLKLEQRFKR